MLCHAVIQDYSKGPTYRAMLTICLDQIVMASTTNRLFLHCDVNFYNSYQASILNNFIGGTAKSFYL